MLLVYSISTYVQVLKNLNIEHCLPSVYSGSAHVQYLMYLLGLPSIFNINIRIYSACPLYSISTYVQDLKNKTIYTVALSMFNINLRSRSEELNYIHLLTLKIFNINPRWRSDVLNYLLGLPSIFNINLHSRSAEFIYTPLLTLSIFRISPRSISDVLNYLLGLPSIFNINIRSRSEEQNYLHGCSQYVQYQPMFKI